MAKPPIVAVVGKSGAGKTTFLEKLIKELKGRAVKVGTIKHHVHDFEMDKPGKDTWRHAQAGSDAVIIASPEKVALIKKVDQEMSLDQVADMLDDMDIILVEGYKRCNKPKIEISRRAHSSELLCTPEELLALVSDTAWEVGVPVFELDDAAGVAELLVQKYGLGVGKPVTGP